MAAPDEVTVWIGLDVGKEEHFADVLDDDGESVFARSIRNDEAALDALLDDAGADGRAHARSRLYRGHAGTLACHAIGDWPHLLAQLEAALARGLYAVPVLAYELGEALFGMPARPAAGNTGHEPAPLAQVLLFARYDSLDADGVAAWLRARAADSAYDPPEPIARIPSSASMMSPVPEMMKLC